MPSPATAVRVPNLMLAALTMTAPMHVQAAESAGTWVLQGRKIYVSPAAAPIEDGVIVIRGNKIVAVGTRRTTAVPDGARESRCSGGILAAGLQNSHVHFTGEQWNDARRQTAEELSAHFAAMLTRYGYTTVVDTASDRDNTLALRARVDEGEIPGPRILTVGLPLFPPDGIPAYLAHFPQELLERMPQPATVDAGMRQVGENLDAGTDATKLFVATPQANGSIKRMPADIARAAADETHRRGRMVMAHPTDIDGVGDALAAGVNILVHTTLGAEAPWPDAILRRSIESDVGLVPTLKLLRYELKKQRVPQEIAERLIAASVAHVRTFAEAGGEILFGTDVGYMTDFDPTEEYVLMSKAGLSAMQILASLTTVPAARWKESERRGRLAAGMDADIVVLDADPAAEAANFARVRCTIRAGKPVYEAAP